MVRVVLIQRRFRVARLPTVAEEFKFLTYHLLGDKKHSFQVERALARLEKVFKRWAKQVHHHHVEMLVRNRVVRANVIQTRNARYQTSVTV